MIRALRAEWTKLWSVPSTPWLVLATAAGFALTGLLMVVSQSTDQCSPVPPGCDEDIVRLSLTGVYVAQAAVAVLAVLAMSTEYSARTIRVTLSAAPRRLVVLSAKAGVVLAVVLTAGALGVLASLIIGRLILPSGGFTTAAGYPPLSLTDGPTLRASVGTVGYLGLVALLGVGLASALRDTALSMITVLGLLWVLPMVTTLVTDPVWRERLSKISPMTAGLSVQATKRLDTLPHPPWTGLGVLSAYACAALVLGAVLLRFRDT